MKKVWGLVVAISILLSVSTKRTFPYAQIKKLLRM